MGNRLSKIYTRTGDDGTTGLGDGSRVAKDDPRVEAYGSVDECNSAIGVILAVPGIPADVRDLLTAVQHELFDLGGELCIPGHRAIEASQVARARAGARRLQRAPAAAQGIHPAGRRSGGGRLPPCARDLPPRGTARLDARARRDGRAGAAAVPQPAVGPAVRARARAGAPRERQRSPLETRAPRRGAEGLGRGRLCARLVEARADVGGAFRDARARPREQVGRRAVDIAARDGREPGEPRPERHAGRRHPPTG